MRYIAMLLTAILSIALAPSSAHADPQRTPALQCTAGGLTAHPKFTQLSPGRAEYSFSGACISRDGHSFAYRIDATWTPPENGRGNANATEILHIDMTSGPSQSYSILLGARCGADPWLYNVNCERVGDNVPDEVRAWWWDVTRAPFPFSRLGIPHGQRAALRAEYDRANGVFDRSSLYSDRAAIETFEKISTQPTGMGMTERAAPAATRPTGAEAGIIIVSGSAPYRQEQQPGTAMSSAINAGLLEAASTNRNDSVELVRPSSVQPPICANARQARARNSPAAPGLERQCVAAGGTL